MIQPLGHENEQPEQVLLKPIQNEDFVNLMPRSSDKEKVISVSL